MEQIELPTFAPWETFTNAQLDGMLTTWRWIRSRPDWAFWHSEAGGFIAAI